MEKSILAMALLTISATVQANDDFIMTTPELLISGGVSLGQSNEALSVKFALQEKRCHRARFCFNPSVMWLIEQSDDPNLTDFSDKINIGAGLDVKYKIPKGSNNSTYVEAGPVAFIKRLRDHGGDKVNLHIGTGVEHRRYTLSVDAYGTDNTLYMINMGYRL